MTRFCEQNNIEIQILRIFNMYGGNDNFPILHHILNALETDTSFVINNEGIAQRILSTPSSHKLFNVGTGISTRISELVELVLNKFPHLKIEHANKFETEYSRAEISRIRSLSSEKFIRIADFIRNEFTIKNASNE